MKPCDACDEAARLPSHTFVLGCKGCEARALARGQEFAQSARDGKLTPEYRVLLSITGLTHEQVKTAAETDAMR